MALDLEDGSFPIILGKMTHERDLKPVIFLMLFNFRTAVLEEYTN